MTKILVSLGTMAQMLTQLAQRAMRMKYLGKVKTKKMRKLSQKSMRLQWKKSLRLNLLSKKMICESCFTCYLL